MNYDPRKHHRRSIRLEGYDYSRAGAYFVTICAQDRACLFGRVVGGKMSLNSAGQMVLEEWHRLPIRFPTVELDAFVVMPNHVHGIIVIQPDTMARHAATTVGAGLVPAPVRGTTTGWATTRVAPTVDGASVAPVDGASVAPVGGAPVDGASVAPVGGAPVDGASVAPVDGASVAPVDGVVAPTVGDIVGAFKSLTTLFYTRGVKQSGWLMFRGRVWQRNYYERIIRNEQSLERIRQYILDNPARWSFDREKARLGTVDPEMEWLD